MRASNPNPEPDDAHAAELEYGRRRSPDESEEEYAAALERDWPADEDEQDEEQP